jgi:CheY-like chemotaxis protein
MQVLIVDDDERTREVLTQWLIRLGHSADDTESAESALQLVKQNEYDVILLDYQMPGHNGLWFMKQAQLPRGTVSLLITGLMSRDVVSEMFRVGIRGYLAKPFTPADLERNIAFYTRGERQTNA